MKHLRWLAGFLPASTFYTFGELSGILGLEIIQSADRGIREGQQISLKNSKFRC